MKKILALIILGYGSLVFASLEIVKDGKACTAIITKDNPSLVPAMAAEELQYHIEQATGAYLYIYPESRKPKGFSGLIYVGKCQATIQAGLTNKKLAMNAFMIKLIGNDLFFYGDDGDTNLPLYRHKMTFSRIGTTSAVYEFLETKLGVRWLWPGPLGEYIPEHKNISVKKWDKEYKLRYTSSMPAIRLKHSSLKGWSSKKAFEKYQKAMYVWLRRHRFNRASCITPGHAFQGYWKRFKNKRPDFFNLLPNGKREPLPGDTRGYAVTMCVSNPDLWKQVVADWKNPKIVPWFKKMGYGNKFICASENDSPGMCTCPRCRSWDAPDPHFKTSSYWNGGKIPKRSQRFFTRDLSYKYIDDPAPAVTDRYMKYYLALQKEAQKINPDVIVAGYAYNNYSSPPKHTKLNDRIQISFVPKVYYPPTAQEIEVFKKHWLGWEKTGAKIILRPNLTNAGHNMPVSYTHWLYDTFTFADKHGMIGSLFDSLLGEWATQGPSHYLIGRLNVRPELSLEAVLGEYYAAFGPASKEVKAYFDYWESISRKIDKKDYMRYCKIEGGGHFKRWLPAADYIFTPEVMRKGRVLLRKAQTVKGLSKKEKGRLNFLDLGLRNAEMTLETLKYWKKYKNKKSSDNLLRFAISLRKLYNFRKKNDSNYVSDMGYLYFREGWTWEKSFANYNKNSTELSGPWKFKFDIAENGQKNNWQASDFDDSKWSEIGINSCWEKQKIGKDWTNKTGKAFNGIGWYRTTFKAAAPNKNEHIYLSFGGVDEACNIYLNSKLIHKRIFDKVKNPMSWNEPFEFDITKHVKIGKKNVLVVRVEDRLGNGGIYKPVCLFYRKAALPVHTSFEKSEEYKVGNIAGQNNWMTRNNTNKKYSINCGDKNIARPSEGKQMFRLTANSKAKTVCLATKTVLPKTISNFVATVDLAYSTNHLKNITFSRILFHNKANLWQGIEIGFICKNGVYYASYRDGSTWKKMGFNSTTSKVEGTKAKIFYRFVVSVKDDGKFYDLKIYDLNGKLKAKKDNIHSHGKTNFDTISILLSQNPDDTKQNILYVDNLTINKKKIGCKNSKDESEKSHRY